MSQITRQCEHCQQIVRQEKYHQHINLHTQPHELVPKTRPNNLKKIGLSKVLHLDDSTDQSDIAVRSILPDEVPQPDIGKRDVPPPGQQGQFSKRNNKGKQGNKGYQGINGGNRDIENNEDIENNGDRENNGDWGNNGDRGNNGGRGNNKNKDGRVGSGINNSFQYGNNKGFGSPANDQLDLQSNVIGVSVQGLQGQKLDIQKEVDLKPKKTVVMKKQIHKYQNTHHAARETVDLGGCDKKVIDHPLAQSRNLMTAVIEPVYQIKQIEKPFLPSFDPKNKATVGFSRKTAQSNPYNAIQTKSVNSPVKNRPNYDYNQNKKNKVGRGKGYDPEQEYYGSEQGSDKSRKHAKRRGEERDRPYPLHPHQCPDCHGFYCSTCKSTIPPSFRPFWDQNQKPEIIQYYKSIQQQAEKEIRHRKQCPHCDQHA